MIKFKRNLKGNQLNFPRPHSERHGFSDYFGNLQIIFI
ncbi:hypothetical protein DI53_0721 [Sphingobacterium deserti]|uniref:Uncharacterized protein n=1 Tax=Sphingobacterium deserti TaxID=1229276 RepID=A0A0B8T2N8_9SPHI|nr:hypothetical protein DI53_0721 [Sphingobacterium deserti]